jgi:predicted ATPase/DNA-binding CsgD family transcriptional regulator/transcriptional regulator with XRE-family HTH domain
LSYPRRTRGRGQIAVERVNTTTKHALVTQLRVPGWGAERAPRGVATDELRSFGELLRDYRRAAGLTQQLLADRAGLSARGIQDLERGARHAPYLETARRLADALELCDDARTALLSARSASPRAGPAETARVPQRAEPKEKGRPRPNGEGLAVPLTSFVGRQHEVLEVQRLLRTTRLLTLTGSGGVGKTRLALEVARGSGAGFQVGVALVELAALADPALVAQSVASALGVAEQPGQPLLHTLLTALRRRSVLLVLDNCEHLVQACAELAENVLRACPDVRILTTSREPLDLGAELIWRVPSLSLPAVGRSLSMKNLTRSDVVCLFIQRASQARPGFELTSANAPAIAQVCQRLDGIPLAIELAAARVNALTVEQIAARLDDSLGLLTGGGRTATNRQRTLRGTLDWSYDLLSEPERVLLSRLAVFAGGWTLEAAEAVCGGEHVPRQNVLDLLSNLVDKSLVVAEERGAAEWYRLLDPLRAYALEKLQRCGDELHVQSRHRDWYVQLAERFETEWRGPRQRAWFDRLEREEGNIRVALHGCLAGANVSAGVRIVGALARFWDLGSRLSEGRALLAGLLSVADSSVPTWARAKALNAAGELAVFHGDTTMAEALVTEALGLWRGIDDGQGIATSLLTLGMAAEFRNEPARASARYEQSLALAREIGDRVTTYWTLSQLARVLQRQGDYRRAQALSEESLALKRQQGDGYGVAWSLLALALLAWLENDLERAFTLGQESLGLFRDLGHWRGIAQCIHLLAHVTGDRGDAKRSARLFGAAEALDEIIDGRHSAAVLICVDPPRCDASLAACRAKLTPVAFEAAWRAGQAMTTDEAAAFALSATAADRALGSTSSLDSGLTDREAEVLRLVAKGKSNQEIAATLVLSRRTVERHISNLCAKVGARNRVEATAYALRSGLA